MTSDSVPLAMAKATDYHHCLTSWWILQNEIPASNFATTVILWSLSSLFTNSLTNWRFGDLNDVTLVDSNANCLMMSQRLRRNGQSFQGSSHLWNVSKELKNGGLPDLQYYGSNYQHLQDAYSLTHWLRLSKVMSVNDANSYIKMLKVEKSFSRLEKKASFFPDSLLLLRLEWSDSSWESQNLRN